MTTADVECPECARVLPMPEAQLGTEVKCPHCKTIFTAEAGAGAYEFADSAPRAASPRADRERPASVDPDEDNAPPETEAERRLRESMEKWAEE